MSDVTITAAAARSLIASVAMLLVTSAAQGAPILLYEASGVLKKVAGPQNFDLDGATYEVAAIVDAMDAPSSSFDGAGFNRATYEPDSIEVLISNRPNSAADLLLFPDIDLSPSNYFLLSLFPDRFEISGSVVPSPEPGITTLILPFFDLTFHDQSFFPGMGIPPLPVFDIPDVSGVTADPLFVFGDAGIDAGFLALYIVENAEVTVMERTIPEPTTILLLGLGLAALGFAKRTVYGVGPR